MCPHLELTALHKKTITQTGVVLVGPGNGQGMENGLWGVGGITDPTTIGLARWTNTQHGIQ